MSKIWAFLSIDFNLLGQSVGIDEGPALIEIIRLRKSGRMRIEYIAEKFQKFRAAKYYSILY